MAEINASGSDIIACGEEILSLCRQYDDQINDLFESFSKINQGAWSGNAANNYVEKLVGDKISFMSFGECLRYYGLSVKKIGEYVDKVVNKWEEK